MIKNLSVIFMWVSFLAILGPLLISAESTELVLIGFGILFVLGITTYFLYRKEITNMRNKIKAGTIFLLLLTVLVGCSKVPAGNVGIKFYLLGGDKGVDSEELSPGRYWIGWNEELYLFPTFQQNKVWTDNVTEDSNTKEGFTFQTSEGMEVGADVGIAYLVNPSMVNELFVRYRKGIDEITNVHTRNIVRDAFNSVASKFPVEKVYGTGKAELLSLVEDVVRSRLEPIGINV